jgi:ACS family glucarate transporter-like MFS transporter/ACS family D-galactonate transporter-like MFS transporter
MGGKHVAPVFSTMNMSGNLGAMVFPVVVPWLVGPGRDWDLVLVVFAGIHLAAAACWALLNPNGTVFDQSPLQPRRS